FFFSSRRRHTRFSRDWSSDVCSSDLIYGTLLSDMQSNYTTIFLRQEFLVQGRGAITNLLINHQSDDGFIAWLNGVEVFRYNVPGDRKSVVEGKRDGVGGARTSQQKKK